jgi:conserved domain protein
METHRLYSVGQVAMLSMPSTGERSLKIISQSGIQTNFIRNLSTAKLENVVKQIECQKWRHIMQEIKKRLKKYILYIIESRSTPQILPELIRQYEVLDEKYPDLKEVNAPVEEAPFDFEDALLPHVKAITQALKKQMTLTGSSFDLAIYSSCTVLNEIDNSSTPVKGARVIYVDEE